jgi:hypothetical protein
MSNVFTVYIVKSFGPDAGYTNLKAFVNENEAEAYAKTIEKQIPDDVENEFVEVEQLDCQSYGTTNRSIDYSFMPLQQTYSGSSKVDLSFIPL